MSADRPSRSDQPADAAAPAHGTEARRPVLAIKAFGGLSVLRDGRAVDLGRGKLGALLVYLATLRGKPASRETLRTLLWGSHFEAQARQNLRKALSRLRSVLGGHALVVAGDQVSVAPDAAWLDAAAFEDAVANGGPGGLDEAVRLYAGEFLRGVTIGQEGWTEWVEERRRAFASTMVDALVARAGTHLGRDDAAALAGADRALGLDPLREDAHRLAMASLAKLGRRTEALRRHEAFAALLRRELRVAPEAETTSVAQSLRQDAGEAATGPVADLRAARRPPVSLPDRPSVAVMPFANLGQAETEHLAEGIVDDITTLLSRVRWLFVIARNSAFTFKGRSVDVRQVGRALGVRYVVEGSVRSGPERVRVTAQLVEAETGANIWAGRFDCARAEIFALEDDLAESIVAAIEPNLLSNETVRAKAKPTGSLDAYDLHLRALPHLFALSQGSYARAEALLRRAVALDAEYAEALTGLAECLLRKCLNGWVEIDAIQPTMEEALRLSRRAVAADPRNGPALAAAANALTILGVYEEALELVERALRIHPNAAEVRRLCGQALVQCGEGDRAMAHFEAALRLSPVDPRRYLTLNGLMMAHFFARRFEEAAALGRRALAENPNWSVARRYYAATLAHLGRTDEARAEIAILLRVQPNSCLSRSRTNRLRHGWMMDLYVDGLRRAGLPDRAVPHRVPEPA